MTLALLCTADGHHVALTDHGLVALPDNRLLASLDEAEIECELLKTPKSDLLHEGRRFLRQCSRERHEGEKEKPESDQETINVLTHQTLLSHVYSPILPELRQCEL